MMQLEQANIVNKEWILNINGTIIPIALIKSSVLFLALCAIFVFSYNIGQMDALKHVEIVKQLCNQGCTSYVEGNTVKWNCSQVQAIGFNTSLIKP